ncbi:rab GTPase-binding effector protein 1 [Drosophila serrata]|uniref:rab GTPase-binding effector protein 1 n=1 Tax=Drosophila serrata TaxID=7274 RepID=UPI000A1D19E1|nr:rab GTPase-binding effector protein 1 [Drosophila serrata]XP_020802356.1 rab GTPase-binding effector protein 1 [Drosophila serrata]
MEENETHTEAKVSAEPANGEDDAPSQHDLIILQAEMRKMQNEFNTQRAKMRELYIQKEAEVSQSQAERRQLQEELDELKTHLMVADLKSENEMQLRDIKAQEEISSLQQLVQDTIEESSHYKAELEHLKLELSKYHQIHQQTQTLAQQPQAESSGGIAPQVLNQVKKTLGSVRKLGSDSLNSSFQQEDDNRGSGKGNGKQFPSEEAEMLHSIVEQLQEEMKALKVKLREQDEQLQSRLAVSKEESSVHDASAMHKSTSMDVAESGCEACSVAEKRAEELNAHIKKQQKQVELLQKQLAESRESMAKEAALRKELEDQWQEKREAHKSEVQSLREQAKTNEQRLLDMQQKFLETKDEVMKQIQRVTDDRERVNKQLETLQADNDFLSGRYLATSEEIENQYINLPNTVVELQELILRQQNELIQARLSSEYERQKCLSTLDETQILRAQLEESNNERRSYKRKMQLDIKSLQDRVTEHLVTVQAHETTKTQLERKEAELNKQLSECRVEIIELQEANEKYAKTNAEYKTKIKTLQEELSTMETVQKDFVKLSQTLQMSLEELRHADTEVRWQDDDDVNNCPVCNAGFTVMVRKIHCRHCGHIYCDKCLTKTVPSGPRKRVARVCDICHTLLTPNTAPYFSQGQAPQLAQQQQGQHHQSN